jgi:predicted HicB family RNase H-like nuclease
MSKRIQVRVDEEVARRLKEQAEKRGHTLSSLVRHLINLFLKEK